MLLYLYNAETRKFCFCSKSRTLLLLAMDRVSCADASSDTRHAAYEDVMYSGTTIMLTQRSDCSSQVPSPPHPWQSIPSPARSLSRSPSACVVQSTQPTVVLTQESQSAHEVDPSSCLSAQGTDARTSEVHVCNPTREWYEDTEVVRWLCSSQYEALCASFDARA